MSAVLRQIRYFQAVVRNNSFSEAAAECHISQSAISQQIKALENELGFPLLERKNRKFVLTPAGEHFYKKSLILMADYEQICSEAATIAGRFIWHWKSSRQNIPAYPFRYCMETMRNCSTCLETAARTWC